MAVGEGRDGAVEIVFTGCLFGPVCEQKGRGRMTIQVFGPGCVRCAVLHKTTVVAAAQLGLDTPVDRSRDDLEMARLGVWSTPALALDGRVLLSGSVPSVGRVRELLAAAVR